MPHRDRSVALRVRDRSRRVAAITCFAGAFSASGETFADGSYGRLDGDVEVSFDFGASLSPDSAALATRFGADYLSMAGLFVSYDEGLLRPSDARRLGGGVEIRPLFLGRFISDLEMGPSRLDLLLDSFGLNVGAYVAWQSDPACIDRCRSEGLDLSARVALSALGRATGPFFAIRGGARLPLSHEGAPAASAAVGFVTLSLGYQSIVDAGSLGTPP